MFHLLFCAIHFLIVVLTSSQSPATVLRTELNCHRASALNQVSTQDDAIDEY